MILCLMIHGPQIKDNNSDKEEEEIRCLVSYQLKKFLLSKRIYVGVFMLELLSLLSFMEWVR